jgi:hypothetical protein
LIEVERASAQAKQGIGIQAGAHPTMVGDGHGPDDRPFHAGFLEDFSDSGEKMRRIAGIIGHGAVPG